MYFEICRWDFKPILMSVVYKTNDKKDFLKNLVCEISLIELENDVEININNLFDYINISESVNNLENIELLKFLESDILKSLDEL